jgi:hypothetical protein
MFSVSLDCPVLIAPSIFSVLQIISLLDEFPRTEKKNEK